MFSFRVRHGHILLMTKPTMMDGKGGSIQERFSVGSVPDDGTVRSHVRQARPWYVTNGHYRVRI